MSNHIISLVYRRKLGSNLRKSLMALLADKASDDGGGIYASKQTIADELDCSKRAVIDTIQKFIAEGLLREVGQRKSPTGYTVEYAINVEAVERLEMSDAEHRRQVALAARECAAVTGEPDAPVIKAHGRGERGAPKPSLNPSSEDKSSSESGEDDFTADHVFEFWNEKAPSWGKRQIRDRTPERRKLVTAPIAQHGLGGWQGVLGNFGRSDFLQRANACHFDWLIQKKNFLKTLEGNYG